MRPSPLIVCVTAVFASVLPAAAAPPGDSLLDRVVQAYQDTQQYQAVVHFEMAQDRGRWRATQSTDIPLALDRSADRLAIDKPDMLLVVDGKLRLKSDQLPGRHLETAAPSPLTYSALVQAVPFLAQPPMPAVAFLLAPDPVAALSSGGAASATPLEADPDDELGRPRLRFKTPDATYTLTIDPDTHLIQRAVIEVDPAQFGGTAGDTMSFTYDYELLNHNQPIDAQAFAFDATGSTAAASLQELMGGGPGAGAGGGGGAHPLEGQDAPAIDLALLDGGRFKLEEAQEQVIVLDFWATWCPPCRESLPRLQGVADWADESGKSVGIYTVNVGETAAEVKPFWQEQGFTMPVVMDSQGKVAGAYGARAIPQTVVIQDGKVKHVHVGYSPDLDETLKAEIEALLEQ